MPPTWPLLYASRITHHGSRITFHIQQYYTENLNARKKEEHVFRRQNTYAAANLQYLFPTCISCSVAHPEGEARHTALILYTLGAGRFQTGRPASRDPVDISPA